MAEIKDLVGGRFVNGGRSVKIGRDCWGLVMEVYQRYGITIPDFTVGAFDYVMVSALMNEAVGTRKWKVVGNPMGVGAPLVVLMRMHPNLITHAGVYIGHNKIMHTMKMTGVITSQADALKSRITGYYKYVQDN